MIRSLVEGEKVWGEMRGVEQWGMIDEGCEEQNHTIIDILAGG